MGWFGFSIFHSMGGLTEKRYLFCYLMPRKSSLYFFLIFCSSCLENELFLLDKLIIDLVTFSWKIKIH